MNTNLRLLVTPTIRSRSPRELLMLGLDDLLVDTSTYWLARLACNKVAGVSDSATNRTYEARPAPDSATLQATLLVIRETYGLDAQADPGLQLRISRQLRAKYPEALPGALDLLKWAESRFTVALFGAGDPVVETAKTESAGLARYFKKVRFVPKKTAGDCQALIAEMAFSPRNTWVLGASFSGDIEPALAAGANCILHTPEIQPKGAPSDEPSGAIFRIHQLADARPILERPAVKAG